MFRNIFDNPALLIILVLIIVLVFGAKRLPDAARSLGRSMRIFKSEVKEMKDDDKPGHEPGTATPLEGRILPDDQTHPARETRSADAPDLSKRRDV